MNFLLEVVLSVGRKPWLTLSQCAKKLGAVAVVARVTYVWIAFHV